MKNKIMLNTLIVLIILLLIGCKREDKIDVSNINNSVNNLIQNIPSEDFSELDDSSLNAGYELIEFDSELVIEEENLKLKEAILRTSEDVLPPFEDFSFTLPAVNLPETITYMQNDWLVYGVDFVSTSLSLNTPSVYLYTTFNYDESQGIKKSDYDDIFKNLIKDSLDKFGQYVNGENVNVNSIDNITADKRLSMIFDLSDCYVIEIVSDSSTDQIKGAIDVSLYFVSKNNPHAAYGEETAVLEYIKTMIKDYELSIYYNGDEGSYVIEHGKNTNYNKYIISKYLGR